MISWYDTAYIIGLWVLTISNCDNFFGLLLLSIPCLGFLHTIIVEYGIQMEDDFFDTIYSKEKFATS